VVGGGGGVRGGGKGGGAPGVGGGGEREGRGREVGSCPGARRRGQPEMEGDAKTGLEIGAGLLNLLSAALRPMQARPAP